MSQTAPLIATGLIQFPSGTTDDVKRPHTINVYADGVQIFKDKDANEPIDIFTADDNLPSGLGTGSMIFTNLLVALQGQALPTEMELSPQNLTIRVTAEQTDPAAPLSHLPNAHFSKFDFECTQTKGGPLVLVRSSATMVLMDQEVTLSGRLTPEGGIFLLGSDSASINIPLPHIGMAALETVEVQTNVERWRDMQLLYSFNEGADTLVHDRSGSNPPLKLTIENTKWRPGEGLFIPKYSDTTHVKASIRKSIKNILNDIKDAKAFSVELWVKPAEAEPGTILAMGKSDEILFSVEQSPTEEATVTGSFLSDTMVGAKLNIDEINHIVFTHTPTEECLYVNGQVQKRNTSTGGSWGFNYPSVLSLGNNPNPTVPDSWPGNFYNVAIYSRALTEEEVLQELRPMVSTTGDFTIAPVPDPLHIRYPDVAFELTQEKSTVELDFPGSLPFSDGVSFPEWQLSNLQLRWEQTGPSSWQVTGGIDATFWRNKIRLVASLIGTDEETRLSFSQQQSPISLGLDKVGQLEFTSIKLEVTLIPALAWDLSTTSEPTFTILPGIRFRNFDLRTDFMLLDHSLSLSEDRLLLGGSWLGETNVMFTSRRLDADELYMYASVPFNMRASLKIPPIYDKETGVAVNVGNVPEVSTTHTSDEPLQSPTVTPQVVNTRLDLELSSNGVLTKVNSHFDWVDLDSVSQHTDIPEFTLYTPPPHKNALLGYIEEELQNKLSEIFSEQGRNKEDYFLDINSQQLPYLYLSNTETLPAKIEATLPRIFANNPAAADPSAAAYQSLDPGIGGNPAEPIFDVKQTDDSCQLTLNINDTDTPSTVRAAFDGLLRMVEEEDRLTAGGLRLLQHRIAERLPLDFIELLYYHYGWDRAKNYIDLHPGMRLRLDFQNYQFVHATEQKAKNGFVGAGGTSVLINSYTHDDGKQYLGFGPFLSRLQSSNRGSISEDGAGGLFDLVKVGARKPFFRLFYPNETMPAAAPEQAILIVGADQWQDLPETAPVEVDNSGALVSFYFRDKAMLIPDIQVFVGNRAVYVPVGTTLRQLIEQYTNIPYASQSSTPDLGAFVGKNRPMRLIHTGLDSKPVYRFLNLKSNGVHNNSDVFDLPLLKGDRFYF